MRPIGLTFKHEGTGRQGEIMLIHECAGCATISINRIAGDDDNDKILSIYHNSQGDSTLMGTLEMQHIQLLATDDEEEIYTQLFGRPTR